jgi:hypothetical protein
VVPSGTGVDEQQRASWTCALTPPGGLAYASSRSTSRLIVSPCHLHSR